MTPHHAPLTSHPDQVNNLQILTGLIGNLELPWSPDLLSFVGFFSILDLNVVPQTLQLYIAAHTACDYTVGHGTGPN